MNRKSIGRPLPPECPPGSDGAADSLLASAVRVQDPEAALGAAAALPDGTALRALARVGVDLVQLRGAVEAAHVSALAAMGIDRNRLRDAARAEVGLDTPPG